MDTLVIDMNTQIHALYYNVGETLSVYNPKWCHDFRLGTQGGSMVLIIDVHRSTQPEEFISATWNSRTTMTWKSCLLVRSFKDIQIFLI